MPSNDLVAVFTSGVRTSMAVFGLVPQALTLALVVDRVPHPRILKVASSSIHLWYSWIPAVVSTSGVWQFAVNGCLILWHSRRGVLMICEHGELEGSGGNDSVFLWKTEIFPWAPSALMY